MSKKPSPADRPDPAIKPAVLDLHAEDITPAAAKPAAETSSRDDDLAPSPPPPPPPPPRKKPAAYSGKWVLAA
ncbi:MAG TPA: hypothetical protein PKE19_02045, partial [Aestuariivirga sp.]|nr:hypothetical protein [Aestuariivirga sp.]